MHRLFPYIGPADIRAQVAHQPTGTRITSVEDLRHWAEATAQQARPDGLIPATFVIRGEDLLLADRRSEHVACAGGEPVRSAGELFLRIAGKHIEMAKVSNQSTGYCPEPESWPAVAEVLDRLGVSHPGGFTTEIVFRRCDHCGERNVVKDGWFFCGSCGKELPRAWNFG
jgi:hypothetical protein